MNRTWERYFNLERQYGFAWAAAQCRALERDAAEGDAASLAARAAAVREHLERVELHVAPAKDAAPDLA